MKEVGDILRVFDQLAPDADTALATVVRVEGSAYRSPGARMLITGGRMIGQVSGGCLERDVVQRAGGIIASETPILVRYETGNDPENGTGYTLGCGGVIEILIEPLNTPAGRQVMRWLAASRSVRCVIETAITKRHASAVPGQRMMVDAAGQIVDWNTSGFSVCPETPLLGK